VSRNTVIRASEIAQYRFCARAWWLGQVMGYQSTNVQAMQQGEERHRIHGRDVMRYHRVRWLALALLGLAAAALAASLLLGLGS
jgi:hypothetical protein